MSCSRFIRIHKSCIAAVESITAIRKTSVFINDMELPTGETFGDTFAKLVRKTLIIFAASYSECTRVPQRQLNYSTKAGYQIFMEIVLSLHPYNKHCIVNDKKQEQLTDQQVLSAYYDNGDNRLLGLLLQRYTLLLLGVCMKYLKNEEAAKDAVQQIFLKVISELHRYKVQYFKSWLYMIARNHCLMQLRRRNYKSVKEIGDDLFVEDEPQLQQHIEKEKLLSLMESSLSELNKEQKTCITLFYLEKKSYNQISEQTGLNLLQVKSFIQNGKRNLKLLVEKKLQQK